MAAHYPRRSWGSAALDEHTGDSQVHTRHEAGSITVTGLIDIWRPVADKWSAVYASVGDTDWDSKTPCSEWTVRGFVEHNLDWQATGGAMLGAATKPGDDWDTIRAAYAAHLSDPSNLDGGVQEFGGIPKQQLAGF